jgi:plasmid maintenance system antidote protein VapI
MRLNDILAEKSTTIYRLAKNSGVPYTTVREICSGKTAIEKCSGETLYKLAKALDVTMESLLSEAMERRPDFEWYKSQVCHYVKDMGDIDFLMDVIKSDRILNYLDKRWYREALYLLAMVDYLCRENDLPLHENYSELRRMRLSEVIYPVGILILCAALESDEPKEESLREAIPEFLRHNIVESEVRNVA